MTARLHQLKTLLEAKGFKLRVSSIWAPQKPGEAYAHSARRKCVLIERGENSALDGHLALLLGAHSDVFFGDTPFEKIQIKATKNFVVLKGPWDFEEVKIFKASVDPALAIAA